MERPKFGARLALVSLFATASLITPAIAGATSVGQGNGDLAFTSGRGGAAGNDTEARIWTVGPNGGTATQVTFSPPAGTGQHRQPNWSPDHTKIAYANGGTGEIRIKDLVANTDTTFVTAVAGQDRPTWSPDGTKIAYGSGGQIFVKSIAPGSIAQPITSGATDERPVWTPDGNALFFNRLVAANDNDIYRVSPVSITATPQQWVGGSTNDWQTSVSPDGTQLCFTRGPKSSAAELRTGSATTAGLVSSTPFAAAPALNCVWSPDGTEIAYTEGAFTAGQLVARSSAGGGSVRTIAADHVPSEHFDGNADWATNFSPTCQGVSASVSVNGFVSIPVNCTDVESGALDAEIASNPSHGNLGGIDDTTNRVIYTPNVNFSGNDSFTFRTNDGDTDSRPATVSIRVANPGGSSGKDVTASKIDNVVVAPRTWRRGPSLPAVVNSRAPVGTTISYRLSEKARATLTFSRRTKGRKVGRKCRKPTRKNRKRKSCTRYVKAGSLQFDGKQGTNKVKFQGRLSRRKSLAVGRYRLTVGAKDGAGNVSKSSAPVFFRIVRR
jgi:Tol biopolymer transport system component